jgi:hypothetical protein
MPTAVTVSQSDIDSLAQHAAQQLKDYINNVPEANDQWLSLVSDIAADAAAGVLPKEAVNDTVYSASLTLFNAITNYGSASGDSDIGNAAQAAALMVSTTTTSAGASSLIAGLAVKGIIASGPALQEAVTNAAKPILTNAVQHLTGGFLSAALQGTASAAMASGVGAAVGVGLSLVTSLISGLFSGPPPPPYSIGTCGLYSKPDIVVRYTWMWGDPSISTPVVAGGPNNPAWRSFPDPKKDAQTWYAVLNQNGIPSLQQLMQQGPGDVPFSGTQVQTPLLMGGLMGGLAAHFMWSGSKQGHQDEWYACYTWPGDSSTRPIDHAMYDLGYDYDSSGAPEGAAEQSVFRQIEMEVQWEGPIPSLPPSQWVPQAPFKDFTKMFFQLWKSNREFQLNGLRAQPDWKVLQHAVTVWNKAHSASSTVTIAPSSVSLLDVKAPPLPFTTYVQWLLHRYGDQFDPTLMAMGNDFSFKLNTGDIIVVTVKPPETIVAIKLKIQLKAPIVPPKKPAAVVQIVPTKPKLTTPSILAPLAIAAGAGASMFTPYGWAILAGIGLGGIIDAITRK